MKDLELVYAVYQYGSFTKAAEELYISQSSLSMAIQRIEGELGLPLFDRRQHPIRLTQAGEEVLRFYREMKPLQTKMKAKVQDIAELRSGSFAIGGTHYILSYILPETLVQFSGRYPGVELKITEAQSGRFKELLWSCDIDLCLKCDVSDGSLQTIRHAFFDELYLAVPKEQVAQLRLAENPLTAAQIRGKEEVAFQHYFRTEDLGKITFLQLTSGNNLYSRSEEIFRHLGGQAQEDRPLPAVRHRLQPGGERDGLHPDQLPAHRPAGSPRAGVLQAALPADDSGLSLHHPEGRLYFQEYAGVLRAFCGD